MRQGQTRASCYNTEATSVLVEVKNHTVNMFRADRAQDTLPSHIFVSTGSAHASVTPTGKIPGPFEAQVHRSTKCHVQIQMFEHVQGRRCKRRDLVLEKKAEHHPGSFDQADRYQHEVSASHPPNTDQRVCCNRGQDLRHSREDRRMPP